MGAVWSTVCVIACAPLRLCLQDFMDILHLFRTVNLKRLQEWGVDDVCVVYCTEAGAGGSSETMGEDGRGP